MVNPAYITCIPMWLTLSVEQVLLPGGWVDPVYITGIHKKITWLTLLGIIRRLTLPVIN